MFTPRKDICVGEGLFTSVSLQGVQQPPPHKHQCEHKKIREEKRKRGRGV